VRVLLDECERVRVAAAVCRDRCFKHDRASDDLNHRECVRIAMRIDTDDVVQLICKHPFLTSSPSVGGHNRCRSGVEPRAAEL
jgi:hypothetical protein